MRLLALATHPVPYASATFRLLAHEPRLTDFAVHYLSGAGGTTARWDSEFGRSVHWQPEVLAGHLWTVGGPTDRDPGPWHRRLAELEAGLWDVLVTYTGYRTPAFWQALAAARAGGAVVLFGTDAHTLVARDGRSWKTRLKRHLWPWLFRLADVALAPSSATVALLRSLGLSRERIALTPFVTDLEWWERILQEVDVEAWRRAHHVPSQAPLVAYAAKLQPWKAPLDLLEAFARGAPPTAHLAFAGSGPLIEALQRRIGELGLEARVHLLGFQDQAALAGLYAAADLFVLPSHFEPFGLVVVEAMFARTPVIVSEAVGARHDLVVSGETGWSYPTGDVDRLAGLLRTALGDRRRLARMGTAARARILAGWTPADNVAALLAATERARMLRGGTGSARSRGARVRRRAT